MTSGLPRPGLRVASPPAIPGHNASASAAAAAASAAEAAAIVVEFEAILDTPLTGNVNSAGTPTAGQIAQWTDTRHIKGLTAPWRPLVGSELGPATLTIAGGTITATANWVRVDTEGLAASDNLETINGIVDGQIVVLTAAHTDRTVVVKDAVSNLRLEGDFSLSNDNSTLTLIGRSGFLLELARSTNNPLPGPVTSVGLVLLRAGVSKLLLRDGTSRLKLGH